MSSPNSAEFNVKLENLSKEWNELRQIQGHWTGAAFNVEVDGPKGRKKVVMDEIHEMLKSKQSDDVQLEGSFVIKVMGKPDDVVQSLPGQSTSAEPLPVMPGPIVASGSSEGQGSYYLLYKWRGVHDYLWFKVDGETEKVVTSKWYHAYE